MFIRPALQHWSDHAKLERSLDDKWLIEDVSSAGVRLRNLATDHAPTLTLDRIHHFDERIPENNNEPGGTLILNVQLLFYKRNLEMEHVAPPGTSLQRYTPTEKRSDIFTKAAEFQAVREFKAKQDEFENSQEGVVLADKHYEAILGECVRLKEQFEAQEIRISINAKRSQNVTLMAALGWWISFGWHRQYFNSLKDARLIVARSQEHPNFPGILLVEQPRYIRMGEFSFRLVDEREVAWVESGGDLGALSTAELVEWALTHVMDNSHS